MLKVVKEPESKNNVIVMNDMEPLEVGIVQNGYYKNDVVMRTANNTSFEVMNLSKPHVDSCWDNNSTLPVKLLPKGEKITIELFNE